MSVASAAMWLSTERRDASVDGRSAPAPRTGRRRNASRPSMLTSPEAARASRAAKVPTAAAGGPARAFSMRRARCSSSARLLSWKKSANARMRRTAVARSRAARRSSRSCCWPALWTRRRPVVIARTSSSRLSSEVPSWRARTSPSSCPSRRTRAGGDGPVSPAVVPARSFAHDDAAPRARFLQGRGTRAVNAPLWDEGDDACGAPQAPIRPQSRATTSSRPPPSDRPRGRPRVV